MSKRYFKSSAVIGMLKVIKIRWKWRFWYLIYFFKQRAQSAPPNQLLSPFFGQALLTSFRMTSVGYFSFDTSFIIPSIVLITAWLMDCASLKYWGVRRSFAMKLTTSGTLNSSSGFLNCKNILVVRSLSQNEALCVWYSNPPGTIKGCRSNLMCGWDDFRMGLFSPTRRCKKSLTATNGPPIKMK